MKVDPVNKPTYWSLPKRDRDHIDRLLAHYQELLRYLRDH